MSNLKKYLAEAFGTAILVIFGCGSAAAANELIGRVGFSFGEKGSALALSTLLISFAFGLVIVAMAYSIGNVSGCHINPAVSFACLVAGKMSVSDFIGYIISQFIGGIAGAGILSFILGGTKYGLGQNGYGSESAIGATVVQAFTIEVILTLVFTFLILYVTSKAANSVVAGICIGLTLVLVHLFGIPFTGTSVNPARSFGPALLMGGTALKQVWLFLLAPLVGAALAGGLFRYFAPGTVDEK